MVRTPGTQIAQDAGAVALADAGQTGAGAEARCRSSQRFLRRGDVVGHGRGRGSGRWTRPAEGSGDPADPRRRPLRQLNPGVPSPAGEHARRHLGGSDRRRLGGRGQRHDHALGRRPLVHLPSPTGAGLGPIFGLDAEHVWTGGQAGTLLFFDGSSWQQQLTPTLNDIVLLAGTSENDIWIEDAAWRFLHFDGVQWTEPGGDRPVIESRYAHGWMPLWPVGGGRAWAGGGTATEEATLYYYDGKSWSAVDAGVPGRMVAIAGAAPDDVWATAMEITTTFPGTATRAVHYDGQTWSQVDPGVPYIGKFLSPFPGEVWLTSSLQLYGKSVIARLKGGGFEPFLTLPDETFLNIAATSTADIHMVGEGGLLAHFDGQSSQLLTGPTEFFRIFFGDGGDRPWALRMWHPALRRNSDGSWSMIDGAMGSFYGASGTSTDDFWLAGAEAAVHWDGQNFGQLPAPPGALLHDVWVSP